MMTDAEFRSLLTSLRWRYPYSHEIMRLCDYAESLYKQLDGDASFDNITSTNPLSEEPTT